jgi:IclR family mhp operon transcriptional activator
VSTSTDQERQALRKAAKSHEPKNPKVADVSLSSKEGRTDADYANGALARGLAVLAAINDHDSASIAKLVVDTGLPKPTVVRLVQTLVREGYVHQDPDSQAYRVTAQVLSLSRARRGEDEGLQFVQAELDQLGLALKWPSEFLLADGMSMRIICNNRAKAPIKLRLFERSRFPMISSAAGVAYLSALAPDHYARVEARLVRNDPDRDKIRAQVNDARERGYASRYLTELEQGLVVASVPVMTTDATRGGGLSLVYFEEIVSKMVLEEHLLPQLREAAKVLSCIISVSEPFGI